MRRGIESHLLDSSPAVRDAAVELIGKYMIESPEVAGEYYQKIAERIAVCRIIFSAPNSKYLQDTGLGVRKRVIKLLRAFHGITDDIKRRTDICTKLVLRMFDEDDTVKDLSIKTLEELWFLSTVSQPALQKLRNGNQGTEQHDKTQLLNKVCVIMGVAASFRDRQSPLEDVLHKIMACKDDADAGQLHARYSEICEVLIDGLVDASELPGFVRGPSIFFGVVYLNSCILDGHQLRSDHLPTQFRLSSNSLRF